MSTETYNITLPSDYRETELNWFNSGNSFLNFIMFNIRFSKRHTRQGQLSLAVYGNFKFN